MREVHLNEKRRVEIDQASSAVRVSLSYPASQRDPLIPIEREPRGSGP
jgi:hypothetical protein